MQESTAAEGFYSAGGRWQIVNYARVFAYCRQNIAYRVSVGRFLIGPAAERDITANVRQHPRFDRR